jgi:hypothetical protein
LWIQRNQGLDSGSVLGLLFLAGLIISLHSRFSWRAKATVLIADLTVIGMYFPFLGGIRYTTLGIASAGVMVAAAFFGKRAALVLVLCDFIGLIGYGYAAQNGWFHPPILLLPGESAFGPWLKSGIVFLTVGSMLAIMIGGLVESLETNVERLLRVSEISSTNEEKFRRLIDYYQRLVQIYLF